MEKKTAYPLNSSSISGQASTQGSGVVFGIIKVGNVLRKETYQYHLVLFQKYIQT